MNLKQAASLSHYDQWFCYWMPYHLERLENGGRRHVYLPVNRIYKPLGIASRDHVDYNAFRAQAMVFATDPAALENVWQGSKLYLYSDAAASRLDYFERLEMLLSRSIKLQGRVAKA